MKMRKRLQHDLRGFTRSDSERLAAIFLGALPPHDGTEGTKRIRRVLLDLVVQLGGVMEAQQQREHRGLLPVPHDWQQFGPPSRQ
jgi:hypothetical protein